MHRHSGRDFARKFSWVIGATAALLAQQPTQALSVRKLQASTFQVNGFDIDTALLGRSQAALRSCARWPSTLPRTTSVFDRRSTESRRMWGIAGAAERAYRGSS